jgi:predicted transcriptional regulator
MKPTMTLTTKISMVSDAFASPKRLLLLFILRDSHVGYTTITNNFKEKNIPIGSSEVYKHITNLMKHGFITKKDNRYMLTSRGVKATQAIEEIINTSSKEPTLTIAY